MNLPTLKEIETDLFRRLQITYSEAFSQLLTELDQILAESRDKLVQEIAKELAVEEFKHSSNLWLR